MPRWGEEGNVVTTEGDYISDALGLSVADVCIAMDNGADFT